jgi:dephospho-CoA kinase
MTRQKARVFTVVLTGGVASGKSTVSNLFEELGVTVIDTDLISRELVEPGQPALRAIVDAFGDQCLDSSGRLDRRRMRSLIFADPAAKQKLEGILHPLIGGEVLRRINELERTPYCIVVIPLYAESSAYGWINRVLVVDASEDSQIERLMRRDGITNELAESMLANQAARAERLSLADDVIVNTGTVEQLAKQVQNLHALYLRLALAANQDSGQKD